MAISSIHQIPTNRAEKAGRKIGAAAGFVGYAANVGIKEGKDVFKSAAAEAVKNGLSKKIGVAVKAGSIGIIAAGVAVGGAVVGGLIGKAIDKIHEKKQAKAREAFAQLIEKGFDLKSAPTMTLSEFEKLAEQ